MRKLVLLTMKLAPVIGAICCASNSLLSYYGIYLPWLGYIMAISFLIAWIALAIYFKFCSFYFMLIGYILISEGLNLYDCLVGLPLSDRGMFVTHCSLIGITILVCTFAHVRDTKKVKQHFEEVRRQS